MADPAGHRETQMGKFSEQVRGISDEHRQWAIALYRKAREQAAAKEASADA